MPLLFESEINLLDYWYIILRRKYFVVIGLILSLIFMLIAGLMSRKTPLYEAKAKIVMETGFFTTEPVTGVGGVVKKDITGLSAMFLQTQYEIIRSRIVAEKALEILKWDVPDRELAIQRIKSSLRIGALQEKAGDSRSQVSNIIEIYAIDQNPRIAMDIANAVARGYIEQRKEDKIKIMQNVYAALEVQVREAKAKLSESEKVLEELKQKEGIVALEGIGANLDVQNFQELNSQLIKIKGEKIEKETLLNTLKDIAQRDKVSALNLVHDKFGIDHPINVKLKDLLFQKREELNSLLQTYKEKHPEVLKAKSDIVLIEQEIDKEVSAAEDLLNADIQTKKNMEEVLNAYVTKPDFTVKQAKYLDLKREVELNKDLYATLLRKLKEADIADLTRKIEEVPDVKIIEMARLPNAPIPPRRLNIFLFPFLGIILGAISAFLREYMDNTIGTIEDVEKYLDMTVLGAIPHLPGIEQKRRYRKRNGR